MRQRMFGWGPEVLLFVILIVPAIAIVGEVAAGALSRWTVSGGGALSFPTTASLIAALRADHWYFLMQQVTRAAIVALIDIAIAVPASHILVRRTRGKLRLTLLVILLLPFFMSSATKAFSWTVLLGAQGPIGMIFGYIHASENLRHSLLHSPFAVAISLVSSSLPLAFLCVTAGIAVIPENVWRLCEDVGTGIGSELLLITVPLARWGLVAGWTASFVVCALASSEIDFASGAGETSLTRVMIGLFDARDPNAAMAMGLMLLVTCTIIITTVIVGSKWTSRLRFQSPIPGNRGWVWLEWISAVSVFSLVLVPAVTVIVQTVYLVCISNDGPANGIADLVGDDNMIAALQHTIVVASIVVVPAVGGSVIVGLSLWSHHTFQRLLLTALCLAAIPGDIYSMGVYFLVRQIGIPLSPLLLVAIAQLPWIFPFVLLTVASGYVRIGKSTLDAARDLGASGWNIFVNLILPQCWPELVLSVLVGSVLSVNDSSRAVMISDGYEVLSEYIAGRLISGRNLADYMLASAGVLVGATVIAAFLIYVRRFESGKNRAWNSDRTSATENRATALEGIA